MLIPPAFQRNAVPGVSGPSSRALDTLDCHRGQSSMAETNPHTRSRAAAMKICRSAKAGASRLASRGIGPEIPRTGVAYLRFRTGHHSPSFTVDTYVHLLRDGPGEPLDLASELSEASGDQWQIAQGHGS
jgi:hypothetical protein